MSKTGPQIVEGAYLASNTFPSCKASLANDRRLQACHVRYYSARLRTLVEGTFNVFGYLEVNVNTAT